MSAYEHQAVDHNASIRAEVLDPDQVTITITHGEDDPTSITMCAEDFDTMARAARPAAQDAPAAPPVGVGTSDAANGAQGGAGGLGDALRAMAAVTPHGTRYRTLLGLADQADALEREHAAIRAAVTAEGPEVSCGGYGVQSEGCYAGTLAGRVLAILDGTQ